MLKYLSLLARLALLPALAASATAADLAAELAPTGTLRAAYIASNPVQAFVDPATKEVRGPAAAMTAELARRAGVPFTVTGAKGVEGVLEAVKNGQADIGFLAYDAVRAAQVDFSQNYALAQNTYLVVEGSPIKSVADADRPGVRIGVGARDAGDYFLTRTLKSATLVRNEGGIGDAIVKALLAGELDAYAGNRMRLDAAAKKTPGLRLVPDNFYGVEQSVIVPKGSAARLAIVEKFIDEARTSGLIAEAIQKAGLVGVDVAEPNSRVSK
ncbi:MAG: transporter substrate-binding domain-containing protein [Alphaproteobacteria bacterium]|nr:transporter substrate-binding domain-containing protein [Alphaproteobacteria bacterium]